MAETAPSSNRLPRGTKPVAQAFLAAVDSVPDASRAAVAKAALAMIRDELKARKEKQRAAKSKAPATTAAKRGTKAVAKPARKPRVSRKAAMPEMDAPPAKPVRKRRTPAPAPEV